MHRKIVFVIVESSVIKISEAFIDLDDVTLSFISIWSEILLGSQWTVNQTTSCQHRLSQKKLVNHIGEVVLESK